MSSPACRICDTTALTPAGVRKGHRFLECPACGFVFTPDVAPAAVAGRYEAVDALVAEGLPPEGWADLAFLEPALRRVEGQGPLRILDFGAGESAVPDLLRRRGHRVVAVDIAPPRRPHPDRLTGDIQDLDLPRDGFDLAYAYQVFEHLPHPRPVLDRLLALTRPGGLLAIHTDMEVPERARGVEGWWYVTPPDHCSFFRHRTFARALRDRPAKVVHAEAKMVVIEKAETVRGG